MGVKYLWDTNTVIYYLQQQFPIAAEKFIDNILLESQPVISSITEIELLCWTSATDKDSIIISDFIKDSVVIELDQTIKIKTAEIRKTYRTKLPDAIIAATAILYDLTLLTRNANDFKPIKGLIIINPFEQ